MSEISDPSEFDTAADVVAPEAVADVSPVEGGADGPLDIDSTGTDGPAGADGPEGVDAYGTPGSIDDVAEAQEGPAS